MREKSQKLQGYVSQDNYNTFLKFKEGKGITSDSQALNILIETFLGNVNDSPTIEKDLIDKRIYLALIPFDERLKRLEDNLQNNLQNNLEDNLQDNLKNNLKDNLEDNPINSLNSLASGIIDNLLNNLENNLQSERQDNLEEYLQDDTEINPESHLQDNLQDNPDNKTLGTDESEQVKSTAQPEQPTVETIKETMNKKQMANLLRVDPTTVGRWVKGGKWNKFPDDWKWNTTSELFEK